MRQLNEHKINPGNDTLTITVLDEPGHGGANHAYDIEGGEAVPTHLRFQNGPINADGNGVNGITHEALLAVLCDRLRGFQAGPYACKANACAYFDVGCLHIRFLRSYSCLTRHSTGRLSAACYLGVRRHAR